MTRKAEKNRKNVFVNTAMAGNGSSATLQLTNHFTCAVAVVDVKSTPKIKYPAKSTAFAIRDPTCPAPNGARPRPRVAVRSVRMGSPLIPDRENFYLFFLS